MKHDIVYILKNNIDDNELIYSIRSVCQNFPHNKIWFAGGMPEHIEPDEHMTIQQQGQNKWQKVSYTLKKVFENDDISDDFWLFNDDFFIMQPMTHLSNGIKGTMHHRVMQLKQQYGQSSYAGQLERTENILRRKGFDTLDYALHIPILLNKQKGLQTLRTFPDCPMFRCIYGNQHHIGGILMDDVKIYDNNTTPTGNELMLSTTEKSFDNGNVGKFIRAAFPHKCKYETGYEL